MVCLPHLQQLLICLLCPFSKNLTISIRLLCQLLLNKWQKILFTTFYRISSKESSTGTSCSAP